MTTDGLTRITELLKDDIIRVEYDIDGVTQQETNLDITQNVNDLRVSFLIGASVVGVIDNFKLIGTTVTLDIRNKTYNKDNDDRQRIVLPYRIELKAV